MLRLIARIYPRLVKAKRGRLGAVPPEDREYIRLLWLRPYQGIEVACLIALAYLLKLKLGVHVLVEGQADFLRLYGVIIRLFYALKRSESPTDAQDGGDTYSIERAKVSSTDPFKLGELNVIQHQRLLLRESRSDSEGCLSYGLGCFVSFPWT